MCGAGSIPREPTAATAMTLIAERGRGSLVPLVLLTTDALARFLSAQDNAIVRATIRDLAAKCRPLVPTSVSAAPPEDPGEAAAYAKRLRARFAKQRELLDAALAELNVNDEDRG
jgi:hypothetical protein